MAADRLRRYRERRDLRRSPEPAGGKGSGRGRRFVIQQHDASSMHFDLRLEIAGVLASWAVPKGLSTDPRRRRLALRTEDHPLDYADFEGVIPQGEYGAGTVLVWDAGRYRNLRGRQGAKSVGMERALRQGLIEVWLEGHKLQGGYALKRIARGRRERWLAIKMDDDAADARRRPASTQPESVRSGRRLAEIADEEGPD